MHGYEHVGARDPRTANAVAQLQELVAIARQHGAHARFRVEPLRERARDGERHVLLARAAVADGAGVLAAVTCVHRDDDVAAALIRSVRGVHRRRFRTRGGGGPRAEVEQQRATPGAGPVGAERGVGFDHEAQRPPRLHAKAHRTHRPAGCGRVHAHGTMRVPEVDHDAVGVLEGEERQLPRRPRARARLRGGAAACHPSVANPSGAPSAWRLTQSCSSRVRRCADTHTRRARRRVPAMACTTTRPRAAAVIVALHGSPAIAPMSTSPSPRRHAPDCRRSHTSITRAPTGARALEHDGPSEDAQAARRARADRAGCIAFTDHAAAAGCRRRSSSSRTAPARPAGQHVASTTSGFHQHHRRARCRRTNDHQVHRGQHQRARRPRRARPRR